jgi:hypothetical protein
LLEHLLSLKFLLGAIAAWRSCYQQRGYQSAQEGKKVWTKKYAGICIVFLKSFELCWLSSLLERFVKTLLNHPTTELSDATVERIISVSLNQ